MSNNAAPVVPPVARASVSCRDAPRPAGLVGGDRERLPDPAAVGSRPAGPTTGDPPASPTAEWDAYFDALLRDWPPPTPEQAAVIRRAFGIRAQPAVDIAQPTADIDAA